MHPLKPITLVLALSASGAALASDDCRRPMAEWQPREVVTARATELGLTPERLRIDDGCYEMRGRDADGNRVSLTLDPATLAVLQLGVRFRPGADVSRYLADARAQAGRPARQPATRPSAPAGSAN
jgi:hypothetical protein